MPNSIEFSIIIPTYNRASLLSETIRSVLRQTEENFELIIVDDGSTDNTKQVVNLFTDHRIKYIYQENKERSAARNLGMRIAKAAWICFLDSDDEMKDEHLEVLKKFIITNDLKTESVIRTLCIEKIDDSLSYQAYHKLNEHPVNYLFDNVLYPSSLCFHRNIFKKYQFNEELNLAEDTELLVKVFSEFPLFIIDRYTIIIKKHTDNTQSSLTGLKQEQYFLNLKSAFSYPQIQNVLDIKAYNKLLSNRVVWASEKYRNEGQKKMAQRLFINNLWLLINSMGFINAIRKLIKYIL